MSESRVSGNEGELIVAALLGYEGWRILERQHKVHGHRVDFLALDPARVETLVEVKVWARGGGRDTVKKAIADAYDLHAVGEPRPYVLVLSHAMTAMYGDMLHRAAAVGAIARVRILGFLDQP